MTVSSYKQLLVWQKSFLLVKYIYQLTANLPKSELYGLTSQMQRCAVSIPSNIAEGQQRNGIKEYRQFLGIAQGSAAELETQLLLVHDLYGIEVSEALSLLTEVQKMIYVLSQKISRT